MSSSSSVGPRWPTHPLQNDDGPPGPESPYLLGFYLHLTNHLSEHPHSRKSLMSQRSSCFRMERKGCHSKFSEVLDRSVPCVTSSSQAHINVGRAGKSYHITQITRGKYFYPRAPGRTSLVLSFIHPTHISPDGLEGETSDTPRQLKHDEIAEWILLDGVSSFVNTSCHHHAHIS